MKSDPVDAVPLLDALRSTRPVPERPSDITAFWRTTLADLRDIDPDVASAVMRDADDPRIEALSLYFRSLGGTRLRGYLLRWRDDFPRPLIVHGHGYGSRYDMRWDWARRGLNVAGFDARGFGRSRGGVSLHPDGYVLTGIEAPQTSILRGAVCDLRRTVEVAVSLLPGLPTRRLVCGRSFSGGLACLAEGAGSFVDMLIAAVPTFGWAEGRRQLVRGGSGREINRYLASHPQLDGQVMRTLAYFDPVNLAADIAVPALMGVGLRDDVVPPETVYAIINHLRCPYEVREFPFSHSAQPEESLWSYFDEEWLGIALRGLPHDFARRGMACVSYGERLASAHQACQ